MHYKFLGISGPYSQSPGCISFRVLKRPGISCAVSNIFLRNILLPTNHFDRLDQWCSKLGDQHVPLVISHRYRLSDDSAYWDLIWIVVLSNQFTPIMSITSGKFGSAVATVGDIDFDGIADFVVGASESANGVRLTSSHLPSPFPYYDLMVHC